MTGTSNACKVLKLMQISHYAHKKIFWESCKSIPNLYCNYSFPIDLAPDGFPFGAKSIEKCNYDPNLVLIKLIPKIFVILLLYYDYYIIVII